MNDVNMKRILTSFYGGLPDLEIAPRLKLRVTLGLLSSLTRLHLAPAQPSPVSNLFTHHFSKTMDTEIVAPGEKVEHQALVIDPR